MIEQDDKPEETSNQHKSLEETMRETLVSGFMEALSDNGQITADQVERMKKLLCKGQISPQILLNVLRADSEADSDE